MITDSCQEHQFEWDGREVVVEEEDSGQEEVRSVVGQPADEEDHTTCPPMVEGTFMCECMRRGEWLVSGIQW